MSGIFFEIGIIVIVATAFAVLARVLKQPPLFGYILAGVTLGPVGAHFIQNHETIEGLQQIGVSLLLFLIGLELDWSKVKHQLKAAAILGLLQVIGSFITGLILAYLGHQTMLTGLYIGLALAFSSTVIVVKLLSESRDLNALHGRLAVGILLIQDIMAILALVILGGITGVSSLPVGVQLLLLLVKTVALLTIVWVTAQYILPPLFAKLARSSELLFLASVAWCFIFTLVVTRFDFPLEIGAFLAGISIAALPYSLDILSRLRALRDFFVILFFVALGSSLVLPSLPYLVLTIGLILLTIIGKPVITFLSLAANGYRSRTAFLTAITQAQLSEFSLIIVAIGLVHHQIPSALASSISFTAIVSILISTFLFTHRNDLYRRLQNVLRLAERSHRHHERLTEEMESRLENHIIIFGYHRMGYHILKKLHELHHHVVVVDFNPDIIQKLRSEGIDCVYGDVEDEEIFDHIRLSQASMVVSTIPQREENTSLIERVKKEHSKNLKLILTSHSIDDALAYYQAGADYVILPHLLGGEYVAELITKYQEHSLGEFIKSHQEELKLLKAKNHALYFD